MSGTYRMNLVGLIVLDRNTKDFYFGVNRGTDWGSVAMVSQLWIQTRLNPLKTLTLCYNLTSKEG